VSIGAVTVEARTTPTQEIAETRVEITTSTEAFDKTGESLGRLPVQVDKSSTAATVMQLRRFEKQNLYGEAFLLACQLVRENPRAEFAYDAAIRTAIVLANAGAPQVEPEIEFFFREAIRSAPLPGRYHVQLAHYYDRTGKADKLRKLAEDYEKNNTRDPDYWITLTRVYSMTGEAERARQFIERAAQQKVVLFPLSLLGARIYRRLQMHDQARSMTLAVADQNYGPWEMRSLLLEFLKQPDIKPEQVGQMVQAALVNEARYRIARGLADTIIRSAEEQRIFYPLKDWLTLRIAEKKAADIEVWLAALMAKREGNEPEALQILMEDPSKATPVIALERAMSLAAANRFRESIVILSVLLAEQPTEDHIRILLAEQYLAAGRPKNALQTLAVIRQEKLSAAQRLRCCETAMSAAVQLSEPKLIADMWMELSRAATFSDLQTMGDIVICALENSQLREKLAAVVAERIDRPDQWPLLLLNARLSARAEDRKAEMEYYSRYLDRAWDDTQMLRFVAELAMQYSTQPLKIESSGGREKTAVSVRVVDTAGSGLAIRLYRRLIELQPMVADNYSALMRVYQMRGEVETAKKVALELAERKPDTAEVQATAAAILDENGFINEAQHFYQKSLRLDPADFAVWLKYADALRTTRAYDEAESIYRKILEEGLNRKPYNQPGVFAALLKLATEAGKTAQLADYLFSLRAKDIPGKPEFLLSASKLFMQVNADDKAETFLLQFQKDFPDSKLLLDGYLLLGQLWFNRGDIPQAVETFRGVMEKFPDSPAAITASFNIGAAYARTGKSTEAIAAWDDLARRYPNRDKAVAALFESALIAHNDLKDNARCSQLLERFLAARSQDFDMMRKARIALENLKQSRPPFESEPAAAAKQP
jgi:predicted Zn-dependent protease